MRLLAQSDVNRQINIDGCKHLEIALNNPTTTTSNVKMGRRQRLISTSILRAIFVTKPASNDEIAKPGLLARILAFFSIFQLTLARYRDQVFKKLRNESWQIEEEEYTESFRSPSKGKRTDLKSVGDLGYSGSVRTQRPFMLLLLICHRRSSRHRTTSFWSSRCHVTSNSPSFVNDCSSLMLSTCSSTKIHCSSV